MAKKRTTPHAATATSLHPRPERWSFRDSGFWLTVQKHGDPSLQVGLKDIVTGAQALSKVILKELPTFTSHDETHLDNVLYWMDNLITDAGRTKLGPVGCALCIVLAYIHDLGMVPISGWLGRLDQKDSDDSIRLRRWALETHADLLDLQERCSKSTEAVQTRRGEWIRNFLRIDYLRATHADEGAHGRVATHLRELAASSELTRAFDFLCAPDEAISLLARLAASHNRKVDWLARLYQARTEEREYWLFSAKANYGTTNLVLPSLLLRVADICDFDRSRTPAILFHQLGLEGFSALGLGEPVEASRLPVEQSSSLRVATAEWMKHLAVDRWEWTRDTVKNQLAYVAGRCPHPAVERTIHHFCQAIRAEINGVRGEVARVFGDEGKAWIELPDEVVARITPDGYTYHDTQFHLEAHQVMQLLMGTALYGNPELCIRELLQNALDAVRLRDLRQKLQRKFDDAGGDGAPQWLQPVDPWTPEERKSPITLTWGRDDDTSRDWIAVSDRGTGMTLDQIKRYLCALGRSYYKSPEFNAEAELLREKELYVAPISQFGIGILSCFMIAEWIEVRTCPCKPDVDSRRPWWVRISGPGALFHFREWKLLGGEKTPRPSTEVKLFLKREFKLEATDEAELLALLRDDFGYENVRSNTDERPPEIAARSPSTRINPARVAAQYLIWPRYPIDAFQAGAERPLLRIDDAFHFEKLFPIDSARLQAEAKTWGCGEGFVEGARWCWWDWRDESGIGATGSRIRLVVPGWNQSKELTRLFQPKEGGCAIWELATFCKPQLPSENHTRFLVNTVHVPNFRAIPDDLIPVSPAVGACLWVDLARDAAPKLSSDRQGIIPVTGEALHEWANTVRGIFARWIDEMAKLLPTESRARSDIRFCFSFAERARQKLFLERHLNQWTLREIGMASWASTTIEMAGFAAASLAAEAIGTIDLTVDHTLDQALVRARDLARDLKFSSNRASELDRALADAHAFALDLVRERTSAAPVMPRARDPSLVRALSFTQVLARALASDPKAAHIVAYDIACAGTLPKALELEQVLLDARARGPNGQLGKPVTHSLIAQLCNEGFWPNLHDGFPPMQLPYLDSGLSGAVHVAPAQLDFTGNRRETIVKEQGYDLVLPFSAIACPRWRGKFPEWEQDRRWRALLLLPLLSLDPTLASEVAGALRKMGASQTGRPGSAGGDEASRLHAAAEKLSSSVLHVLIPKPELWDQSFDKWTDEVQGNCGYSVQWSLPTGKMWIAVGTVSRDSRKMSAEEFLEEPNPGVLVPVEAFQDTASLHMLKRDYGSFFD